MSGPNLPVDLYDYISSNDPNLSTDGITLAWGLLGNFLGQGLQDIWGELQAAINLYP